MVSKDVIFHENICPYQNNPILENVIPLPCITVYDNVYCKKFYQSPLKGDIFRT